MADLLNIAVSGLNAHQLALNITGTNITNANAEGYTRQEALFQTTEPTSLAGISLGSGVQIGDVRRIVDQFVVAQVRNDLAAFSASDTLNKTLDQLDRLFASSETGLSGSLEDFFAALQTATNSPTSAEARQALLSEANALTDKFNQLYTQLSSFQRDTEAQIRVMADQVTNLADQIASLNTQIKRTISSEGNANQLLDKREETIRQLSELVGINVSAQGDGLTNVFIGSGQALVVGEVAFDLSVVPRTDDPKRLGLAITAPGAANTTAVSSITNGKLGALLSIQDSILANAFNSLGLVGLGVSGVFNQIHGLGLDLEGNLGGNIFTDINDPQSVADRTIAFSQNSLPSDQVVQVNVSDVNQLTKSDYRLTFTGANTYVLFRQSDGLSNTALDPSLTGTIAGLPATLTVDGMAITLDRPSGSFAVGDSFTIQPTRNFATDIQLQINRQEELAFASPVRTQTNLSNTGTATISAGDATDVSTPLFTTTPGQLTPPLLIQFTSPTSYDILNATTSATIVAGLTYPPTPPAGIIPTGVGLDGVQVEISGVPAAGDEFTIEYNTNGIQDNRVGLAMTNVQTQSVLLGGTATIDFTFALFLQELGSSASLARENRAANMALLEQSQERLSAESGVNLDEEAAKLIQFEQAYSAAAQLVTVARSIFDTLLNAAR